MEDSNNNYFAFMRNTIRGTYSITTECSTDYINDIQYIINKLIEEKSMLEKQITQVEYFNMILLRDIRFLDRIYYGNNITHSNTINFIIKNSYQIKIVLDRLIKLYTSNLYIITSTKEKIYKIQESINTYKPKINIL